MCVNSTEVCVNSTEVCVNSTEVCVNSTEVCVNSTEVCVNSTEVCVNSTEVCVNSTEVRVNSTEVCVNSTEVCVMCMSDIYLRVFLAIAIICLVLVGASLQPVVHGAVAPFVYHLLVQFRVELLQFTILVTRFRLASHPRLGLLLVLRRRR